MDARVFIEYGGVMREVDVISSTLGVSRRLEDGSSGYDFIRLSEDEGAVGRLFFEEAIGRVAECMGGYIVNVLDDCVSEDGEEGVELVLRFDDGIKSTAVVEIGKALKKGVLYYILSEWVKMRSVGDWQGMMVKAEEWFSRASRWGYMRRSWTRGGRLF